MCVKTCQGKPGMGTICWSPAGLQAHNDCLQVTWQQGSFVIDPSLTSHQKLQRVPEQANLDECPKAARTETIVVMFCMLVLCAQSCAGLEFVYVHNHGVYSSCLLLRHMAVGL